MKLRVLVDNNTLIDENYFGEPGLSYYIEEGDNKILFDTGYSNIFIQNAEKMDIDLNTINKIVLSHGHLDHTWGLSHLIDGLKHNMDEKGNKIATLITHPSSLLPKQDKDEPIGMKCSEEELNQFFNVHLSDAPVWITEKLVYLGQIERTNDFENKKPLGVTIENGSTRDDYLMDDSALVYNSKKGLVIITGCSHSGICNIIEYAKKVCNEKKVHDIIGGLHLLKPSEEQMKFTLEFMGKLKPKKVHSCHCTDLHSKIALAKVVNIVEVGVGMTIEYP